MDALQAARNPRPTQDEIMQKLAELALCVEELLPIFPTASQDKISQTLASGDKRALFSSLEDLIRARQLDDLLLGNGKLRGLAASIWHERYPWLKFSDLGASLWEVEQDSAAKARRHLAKRMEAETPYGIKDLLNEGRVARAKLARDGVVLPKPQEVDMVPLAPAAGGPVPRQPFTADWTPRPLPADAGRSFNPESTCEDFVRHLPANWVPRKLLLPRGQPKDDVGRSEPVPVPVPGSGVSDSNRATSLRGGQGTTEGDNTGDNAGQVSTQPQTTAVEDPDVVMIDDPPAQPVVEEAGKSSNPPKDDTPKGNNNTTTTKTKTTPKKRTKKAEPRLLKLPETPTDNWLLETLKSQNAVTSEDVQMVQYRGWRIHSPRIQLIRIRNFLADEDMDRTQGWNQRFSEIVCYLIYLRKGFAGQHWGWDLQECIAMAKAHSKYQEYNYGEKKLNLDFSDVVVDIPRRLEAPPGAPHITLASRGKEEEVVKRRYLQPRATESIYDVDYQVPGLVLRDSFLRWYREDTTRVWHLLNDPILAITPKPATVGSGDRGEAVGGRGYETDFNMAEVADERFMRCLIKGPEETARALREEANFYLPEAELVFPEDGSIVPDGHAARRFAKYRGAKRAAIQQCLQRFNNDEHNALITPFNKLVLPKNFRERERLRAEAGKYMVYKPVALKEPPEEEKKIDPLGYVYWHSHLLDNHDTRAEDFKSAAMEEKYNGWLRQHNMSEAKSWAFSGANFLGPYAPSYLSHSNEQKINKLKRYESIITRLERAYRRAPRPLLGEILDNIGRALQGEAPTDAWVQKELKGRHREINQTDLDWLDFMSGPSTGPNYIDKADLTAPNLRMEVFADRIDTLLNDPWRHGILASAGVQVNPAELQAAINNLGGGTPGNFVYTEEEIIEYSQSLAELGRLGFRERDGKPIITRPDCPYHPEVRINWYATDTLDENLGNLQPSGGRHPDDLPPPRTPPLTWGGAVEAQRQDGSGLRNSPFPTLSMRTEVALKIISWRFGYAVGELKKSINRAYAKVVAREAAETESAVKAECMKHVHRQQKWWYDAVTSAVPEQDTGPVKYGSVVRAADPTVWKEDMRGDVFNKDALEAVRKGLVTELGEAKNMLWPVRQRWKTGEDGGEEVATLGREPIWDWARPGVRGMRKERKQYFSLDKWPLRLQSEATRKRFAEETSRRVPLEGDYCLDEEVAGEGKKEVDEEVVEVSEEEEEDEDEEEEEEEEEETEEEEREPEVQEVIEVEDDEDEPDSPGADYGRLIPQPPEEFAEDIERRVVQVLDRDAAQVQGRARARAPTPRPVEVVAKQPAPRSKLKTPPPPQPQPRQARPTTDQSVGPRPPPPDDAAITAPIQRQARSTVRPLGPAPQVVGAVVTTPIPQQQPVEVLVPVTTGTTTTTRLVSPGPPPPRRIDLLSPPMIRRAPRTTAPGPSRQSLPGMGPPLRDVASRGVVRGEKEIWKGDTPRQVQAIEEAKLKLFKDAVIGDTPPQPPQSWWSWLTGRRQPPRNSPPSVVAAPRLTGDYYSPSAPRSMFRAEPVDLESDKGEDDSGSFVGLDDDGDVRMD